MLAKWLIAGLDDLRSGLAVTKFLEHGTTAVLAHGNLLARFLAIILSAVCILASP